MSDENKVKKCVDTLIKKASIRGELCNAYLMRNQLQKLEQKLSDEILLKECQLAGLNSEEKENKK